MLKKKILSVSRKISSYRKNGKPGHIPKEVWNEVAELIPHFTNRELAAKLGISAGHLHRKAQDLGVSGPRSRKNRTKSKALVPTLVHVASVPEPEPVLAPNPVVEMELPSGATIRIFA